MMMTSKNDKHKADAGKPSIALVPTGILWEIAKVRDYGLTKYPETGRNGWKEIGRERILNAFLRHVLRMIEDPNGVDEESGLPHRAHAACELAFLSDMAYHEPKQEDKDGWIPVTDHLPEGECNVLVSCGDKYVKEVSYCDGYFNATKDSYEYAFDDVVAWMPLPPTYKEDKHGSRFNPTF